MANWRRAQGAEGGGNGREYGGVGLGQADGPAIAAGPVVEAGQRGVPIGAHLGLDYPFVKPKDAQGTLP